MVACWHVTKRGIQPVKFWFICNLCLLIPRIPPFNAACLCFHKLLRSCNRLLLIMFYDIGMLHSATFDEFHICTSLRDKHQAAANILLENLVVLNFYLIFCFHILVMRLNHEASYSTEFRKAIATVMNSNLTIMCVGNVQGMACMFVYRMCVCAFLPLFVYSKSVFTIRRMIYWILKAFLGQKVHWLECCYAKMTLSRYIYHFHHLSLAR